MRLVPIPSIAAALALLPSAASAGQVSVAGDTMRYQAAPGEANQVSVKREDAHNLVLTDATATVTTGAKCTSLGVHEARCTNQGANGLREELQLGDGNDSGAASFTLAVAAMGLGAEVFGGPGNDVVTGGTQSDTVDGGDGDDTVDDGDLNGNTNHVAGGNGDDRVDVADVADEDGNTPEREMAPTADDVSCGPGKDRIDRDVADPTPVDCEIVALLQVNGSIITGTDGDDFIRGFSGDGDADTIYGRAGADRLVGETGADTLFGQDGDDRLEGDGQPSVYPASEGGADVLSGGAGADHLIGGYGGDRLNGGKGKDRISGGKGNDRIGARDDRRDKVRCGTGYDKVTADHGDVVASDCEVVKRG